MNNIIEKLKLGMAEVSAKKSELGLMESGTGPMNPPVALVYADLHTVKTFRYEGYGSMYSSGRRVYSDNILLNVFVRTRKSSKDTSVELFYISKSVNGSSYQSWQTMKMRKIKSTCDVGEIWAVEGSNKFLSYEEGNKFCRPKYVIDQPGYGMSYGGEFQYAIKYTEGDKVYWDNNKGWNYNIIGTTGGGYYFDHYTNFYSQHSSLEPNKTCYSVNHPSKNVILHMLNDNQIILRNIAYEKKVYIVYTENNWETTTTITAGYTHMLLGNAWEVWSFDLPAKSSTMQFYIIYECDGGRYYDNNFGRNYKFTGIFAGEDLKEEECLYDKKWNIDNGFLNSNSFK